MKRRGFGYIALLVLVDCSARREVPPRALAQTAPLVVDALAPPTIAAVSRTVPKDPEANADIIVGNMGGITAWPRDGGNKRVVSKGPAMYPRWLDDANILVVRPQDEDNLAKGGWIEKISIMDGKRVRLAKLPPFACVSPTARDGDPKAESTRLTIQDPTDFVVDESGRLACLTLMDRNINMADVLVRVEIELGSGKVSRWLEMGDEQCIPPKGVKIAEHSERCAPRHRLTPEAAETGFRFAFDAGHVVELMPSSPAVPTVGLRGYAIDKVSPSGRWVLLAGDQEDGDYIHQQIVLLDRTTGEVFPIRKRPGAWPGPLKTTGSKPPFRIRTPVVGTAGVVGETDIRWLGRSATSELLVVDGLVVRPGAAAFSVGGEVAR
jgi:hypothetical protein